MKNVLSHPTQNRQKLAEAVALYEQGQYALALKLFLKLVDEGYDEAFIYIGFIYESDTDAGVANLEKARFYFEQARIRTGRVLAYLGLIRIYLYGGNGLRDYETAAKYCELVIDTYEDSLAYFYLGHMYLEGMGIDIDLDMAANNFRKSWERGLVFGLAFLGATELRRGHIFTGWWHRIRAGFVALRISVKDSDDWRVQMPFYPKK